ncbi:hypothetical protein GCY66_003139 [Escherichia coli]|nr:hypothetical protein [Escherichia coli]EHH4577747.1 hypothetical protein [Escherichia coli]
MQQRIEGAWGQQDETCCDAGTLVLCKMPALLLWKSALSLVPALLLWKSALSLVLAILPADILRSANRLLLFPDRFVIPFFLFIMGITLVLACLPACLHRFSKIRKVQSRGKSGVLFSRRWITGQICWHFTSRSIRQKETSTGNRFMHSAFPFTNRYTNVLLHVLTRPVHHRRWCYTGCWNNMEEQ